jgi:hypothetical protein
MKTIILTILSTLFTSILFSQNKIKFEADMIVLGKLRLGDTIQTEIKLTNLSSDTVLLLAYRDSGTEIITNVYDYTLEPNTSTTVFVKLIGRKRGVFYGDVEVLFDTEDNIVSFGLIASVE